VLSGELALVDAGLDGEEFCVSAIVKSRSALWGLEKSQTKLRKKIQCLSNTRIGGGIFIFIKTRVGSLPSCIGKKCIFKRHTSEL
jgi:hypothetical protein